MGQSYQRKLQQAEQTLSKPIIDKLLEVIRDFGKRNGYTAIFDKQASGLVYSQDSVDLTNTVIAELNKAMRGK
jgi:outer membrane protein